MKIEWNKVTWYSMAFAVVLYVTTFLLGVLFGSAIQYKIDQAFSKQTADLPTPIEEVVHISESHYVNKDFGIEFDILLPEYPVKQTGNTLSSSLSGTIERFDIQEGQNIKDAIAELVYADLQITRYSENDVFTDACTVLAEPWIPHEYFSDTYLGSILYSIYYKELDSYYDSVEKKYQTLFGDNYVQLEVGGEVASYVIDQCSRFVSVYSQPSGFFLYNPLNAPDRFYFVDTTNHGGEALFYDTQTIRVLPD